MTRCLPWLLLATGCVSNSRVLHVQARADETQQLEILAAADLWNQAMDEVDPGRPVEILFDHGGAVGDDKLVFYSSGTGDCSHEHKPDAVSRALGMEGQVVMINLDCPIPFRDRVTHELGHYLGMMNGGYDGHGHVRPMAGLMAPAALGSGEVAHELTCADIADYCQHNVCTGRRPARCQ